MKKTKTNKKEKKLKTKRKKNGKKRINTKKKEATTLCHIIFARVLIFQFYYDYEYTPNFDKS